MLSANPSVAQKRRILRLMNQWAKKASNNDRQEFQSIVDNEMEHIDIIYRKLAAWAKNQGTNTMKAFQENLRQTEKEAFEKREELGNDVDQFPPIVLDAFQVVDMFRQDPTRSKIEEKKMIFDLKKLVGPQFASRYEILLDRAQKLQDEYGINLFRSPFVKQRKRYFGYDEL